MNSKERNNLVENEFYTMKLAKLCGLNTAKFKLVKDKDKNLGLLVTRFDKEFIDNNFVFHHQEDGCQLLDRYPADKYRISLNEIAKKILEIASAPQNCILAVLQLYCFSYIIGNGDLHAKNISLIQKNASSFIELSPIYDLICTHIYGDRKMAIKIDGRDDNIKSSMVIDFAKRQGVSEPATKLMINNIINKIQKNINLIFKISMPEKASNYLKKTIIKRINDLKI
ncbi:MAG: HipA domain-containing protein [Candidatus Riflebacteria bacterium]|nr:HipA domain-containing protein [Candidatus Riflebacteria bacterium]